MGVSRKGAKPSSLTMLRGRLIHAEARRRGGHQAIDDPV
jgi:hypothetical protein